MLAGGDTTEQTRLNTSMRRIDLVANIASPLLIGAIISTYSPEVGALFIMTWSLVSGLVEYKIATSVASKLEGSFQKRRV